MLLESLESPSPSERTHLLFSPLHRRRHRPTLADTAAAAAAARHCTARAQARRACVVSAIGASTFSALPHSAGDRMLLHSTALSRLEQTQPRRCCTSRSEGRCTSSAEAQQRE
jgi:hypothetical protein